MPVVWIRVRQATCSIHYCGHVWLIRRKGLPKFCPKCKRKDWNKPQGNVRFQQRKGNQG